MVTSVHPQTMQLEGLIVSPALHHGLGQRLFEILVELKLVQPPVNSPVGEQLLVGSGFSDLALVHYDYFINRLYSRQSMCDDQRSSALHQAFDGVSNQDLGLGIYGTGGFVEDQHGWIECQCPRKT